MTSPLTKSVKYLILTVYCPDSALSRGDVHHPAADVTPVLPVSSQFVDFVIIAHSPDSSRVSRVDLY